MDNDEILTILKQYLDYPEETSNVDFKRELFLKQNRDRNELAKDLACFANADGGFIVIGVVDGSWELFGIDSNLFNVKAIHDVARTRVNPSVMIEVYERVLDNLNYGLIRIDKSTEIHEVDGRVYKRVDDKCLPLQPHEILKLQSEKVEYKTERLSDVMFPKIHGEYKDLAKRLVQSYPKHSLRRHIEYKISKQGEEAKFIEERVFHGFYEQAIEAIDFEILPDTSEIPLHILNAVALRAYGMMQIVRAGMHYEVDENEVVPGILEDQEIHIHLKLNPAKMKNWLNNGREEAFFDWMETFRGFKQNPKDRKLFEVLETLDKREFDEWITNEYGSERLARITRLYREYNRIFQKTIENSNYSWATNVGRLFTDSWLDILRKIKKGN
ncbi:MAG: ATP-binding protein [Candidatus Thorarchaeota archaeon]|nr:ATP-binding protein [Candidatus Thorarchaeota archaeon]